MTLNASVKLKVGGPPLSRGGWGGRPCFLGSGLVGSDQIVENHGHDDKIFPLHLLSIISTLHG